MPTGSRPPKPCFECARFERRTREARGPRFVAQRNAGASRRNAQKNSARRVRNGCRDCRPTAVRRAVLGNVALVFRGQRRGRQARAENGGCGERSRKSPAARTSSGSTRIRWLRRPQRGEAVAFRANSCDPTKIQRRFVADGTNAFSARNNASERMEIAPCTLACIGRQSDVRTNEPRRLRRRREETA